MEDENVFQNLNLSSLHPISCNLLIKMSTTFTNTTKLVRKVASSPFFLRVSPFFGGVGWGGVGSLLRSKAMLGVMLEGASFCLVTSNEDFKATGVFRGTGGE